MPTKITNRAVVVSGLSKYNFSLEIMDAPRASVIENTAENTVENVRNGDQPAEKPQPQHPVTSEQVNSASGLRKRRNITRKRTSSLTRQRELTPVRDLGDKIVSSDEDTPPSKPKTPERRRKRVTRKISNLSERIVDSTNTDTQTNGESTVSDSMHTPKIQNGETGTKEEIQNYFPNANNEDKCTSDEFKENISIDDNPNLPKYIEDKQTIQSTDADSTNLQNKKEKTKASSEVIEINAALGEGKSSKIENLVNISQTEFIAMLDKAKKTIKTGRDKYNRIKGETIKRSQSAPRQLTDEQMLESFRKAQEQSAERELQRRRINSYRKYSSDSVKSTSSAEQKIPIPVKPSRRQAEKPPPRLPPSTTKRKPVKHHTSNKIIEVLDPKTSKVIKTTEIINIKLEWRDLPNVTKCFTIKEIFLEYKKFKLDMKEEYNKIRSMRRKCFGELLLMIIICGLGGVMFKFVEGAFENFYKCGVKRVKRDFIDLLWVKSHNLREEDWKSLARNRLMRFEEELHVAHEAGIHTYAGQRSWSFLNGVLYCITIVTTIGYGHIYPITPLGKGLTILYAVIGIPLFLIILTDFGKLLTRCIKYVWAFFRRLCYTGRCRRVRKTTHVEEIFKGAQIVYDIATMRRPSMFDPNVKVEEGETGGTTTPGTPAPSNFEIDDNFNLPITLALFMLVSYIILGAVAFNVLEGWSFFTSFYFVFISMSTIGFGDFVPEHHTFMIFTIVYLVFGLALMSMCINVVQDKLSDTFKQASAKLGATLGVSVNDEDGSIMTVPPEGVEMPEVHNADAGSIRASINTDSGSIKAAPNAV